MASPLFFEGKNVDKAVQKACEELSIPQEKLKYEIVSHGSTGIFGLVGVKKAKIKVSHPETDRKRAAGFDRSEKSRSKGTDAGCDRDMGGKTKEAQPQDENSGPGSNSESATTGLEALTRIIDTVTSGAKVTVSENKQRITFNVNGGNAALLIGKRGQTLDAIQYIVEKVVNKKAGSRVRIHVDVEGYLENRRVSLQELALRMAAKTKKTGKPNTIGQMSAHDRRIVHLTLKNDKSVRTQSKGDGFLRKLIIFPSKNTRRRKKDA